MAGVAGAAYADADAGGRAAGSPGLVSGNLVQLPVQVPVNVCGNTVSVAGLLNPAAGNTCVNDSGPGAGHGGHGSKPVGKPGPGRAGGQGAGSGGGAQATGSGKDSPGLLSGNGIQLPVDIPLNVSGNSIGVAAVGNASHGNTSVNGPGPVRGGGKPVRPPVVKPVQPPAKPVAQPPAGPPLAHTGATGLGYLAPTGAGLLLGGALLYRRFRPSS